MARLSVALIVTLIVIVTVDAHQVNKNENENAFALSSNALLFRMLGLQLGKNVDSTDEVANVIESTSDDTEKQPESETSTSASQVITDTSSIDESKLHSKVNKSNKLKKILPGDHKDSNVQRKDDRSKWFDHCNDVDNESSGINHPYDIGCLFKQLHGMLMKKSSFKGWKDVAKQCAKACVEVYSSEITSLTQCVQGCNLAIEKQSTRVKQPINRSKSHASKIKNDHKKITPVKVNKKKNSVTKKPATDSPSSLDEWIVMNPDSFSTLMARRPEKDSDKTITPVTGHRNIADDGKHSSSQLASISNLMSPQSHTNEQNDWVEPLYKTSNEPFESIEQLLSKSWMKSPASTLHVIKSSITLFTDNDSESNDENDQQHASPLPLDDVTLTHLKTTDSVYSDSSDLNLMEPRVIIFGETDSDFPIQTENHSTKHIYKSPGRSTWQKIWECFKSNFKYDYFRIIVIALCVFLLLLIYFILIDGQLFTCGCVPAFISMFAKPVKYSRVPTSDGSVGGRKNRSNTSYQRHGSESNYENDSLLSSDDESTSSTSESISCELIVDKNHHPPSYEEAQADESRNSRSLLVGIDLPLPGNSEPRLSSNKLIV